MTHDVPSYDSTCTEGNGFVFAIIVNLCKFQVHFYEINFIFTGRSGLMSRFVTKRDGLWRNTRPTFLFASGA